MSERREVWDNPRAERIRQVAALSRRSVRKRTGKTRVEGPQAVFELLLSSPAHITALFCTEAGQLAHPQVMQLAESAAREHGFYLRFISQRVEHVLSDAAQGFVAVVEVAALPEAIPEAIPKAKMTALVLPETQDPGNLGTLIRLADACGAEAVFCGEKTADPASPKVIRASVGSVFHLPTPRFSDFGTLADTLHGEGWQLWATDLEGDVVLNPQQTQRWRDQKIAWVMGNEAHGLPRTVRQLCDYTLTIPMFGACESLNVTSAATLVMWLTAAAQNPDVT